MSLSPLFLELSTIMAAFSDKTKRRSKQLLKNMVILLILPPKSLRTSKSKTIGLIVPNIDNEWFSQLAFRYRKLFFLNTIIQYLFVIPHKNEEKRSCLFQITRF